MIKKLLQIIVITAIPMNAWPVEKCPEGGKIMFVSDAIGTPPNTEIILEGTIGTAKKGKEECIAPFYSVYDNGLLPLSASTRDGTFTGNANLSDKGWETYPLFGGPANARWCQEVSYISFIYKSQKISNDKLLCTYRICAGATPSQCSPPSGNPTITLQGPFTGCPASGQKVINGECKCPDGQHIVNEQCSP